MEYLKKIVAFICIISMTLLSGCNDSNTQEVNSDAKDINIAFYVSGTLGDKDYFDDAKAGMEKARDELGINVKIVEGGANQTDWAAGFESLVSSKKYDVIVTGSSAMMDIAKDVANRYPDQKIIFFDDKIDNVDNIYSMHYSTNEGAFIAGAFAALVTSSKDLQGANEAKVIGFLGGMDIPVIENFKVGYEQGASYVDEEVQVVAAYTGDWTNAAKAKELALAMYNYQEVDIAYNVAGGAGFGLCEAGNEVGKYAIGVSEQPTLYPGSVLLAINTKIGDSILRAIEHYLKDELAFGQSELLGIEQGIIQVDKDELYEQHVPDSIKEEMDVIIKDFQDGKIEVATAFEE